MRVSRLFVSAAMAASSAVLPLGAQQDLPELVLMHAHVHPMETDTVLADHAIVIRGQRVERIVPSDSLRPGPGSRVVDLGGAHVLPGLIDAHVHLREPSPGLALYPAAGVTTVFNLEGEPGHLSIRDSVRAGTLPGPRILSSGPFLEELVETPAEARAEVIRQAEAGYDFLKIHGEIGEAAFLEALSQAEVLGLPVIAHHPDNLAPDLVLGRVAALAHLEEMLGSLIDDPVDFPRDSLPAVGRRIADSGTAVMTTLAFFTGMRDQATDVFFDLIRRPELAYVSPTRRRAWIYDGHREYIDADDLVWYDAAVEVLSGLAAAIHAAGGEVIAGTDTPLEFMIPGDALHRELEALVSAGLSPRDAIRSATVAAADFAGRGDLGRIEAGAAADLLVLGADPMRDLGALDRIQAVVVRGRLLTRDTLARRLGGLAAMYAREEIALAADRRLRHEIAELVRTQGVEAAAAELDRLERRSTSLSESEINDMGYEFLGARDVDTAIDVFRLNVSLHPGSANVYDSLGEAYLSRGELRLAERNYRRALELDPTLDSARRALEEIARRRPQR